MRRMSAKSEVMQIACPLADFYEAALRWSVISGVGLRAQCSHKSLKSLHLTKTVDTGAGVLG